MLSGGEESLLISNKWTQLAGKRKRKPPSYLQESEASDISITPPPSLLKYMKNKLTKGHRKTGKQVCIC